MADAMREMVNLESAAADMWRDRAVAAEHWWVKASALLADIGRRQNLPISTMTRLRELMKWEPNGVVASFEHLPLGETECPDCGAEAVVRCGLRKFAQHADGCPAWDALACTCGLSRVIHDQ